MFKFANARYRCTSCGDCCHQYDVPLDAGEADRFRAQMAPLISADRLKLSTRSATHGGVTIETLPTTQGGCVALDGAGLCRIHALFGEPAKPKMCRVYPYTFVATPDGEVRVGASFSCAAVVDDEGPLLEEQQAEIETTYRDAVAPSSYQLTVSDPVALDRNHKLRWRQASQLIDEIAARFEGEGTLLERICAAGCLNALVRTALDGGKPFDDALAGARDGAAALVKEALAARLEVDRLSRTMFGTMVRVAQPAATYARVRELLPSLSSGGAILLGDGRQVPVKKIEQVRAGIGPEGERLYARWLAAAVRALTFFGDSAFGLSLSAGLDFLALAAAVGCYLARGYAAADGRTEVTLPDAKAALRQLDGGLRHRSGMPAGFDRALEATAAVGLLREQLG